MAELNWTSRLSHFCIAGCGVMILVLLVWCELISADDGLINFDVENCTEEDSTSWSVISQHGLNVTGKGTRCHAQCSPSCNCTLDGDMITSNCSHGNISTTPFFYPSDVRYLSWEDSVLNHIATGTFEMFGSLLKLLQLCNINLLHLQGGVLRGLSGLRWLFLDHNQLDKLQSGGFKELQGLKVLDLRENRLRDVVTGAFEGLVSLEWLYLSGNELRVIEAGVFDALVSVERLYLDRNELSVIETGAFGTLKSLEVLYLQSNELRVIEAGVFDTLVSLERLDLHGNELGVIGANTFGKLVRLEWLELHGIELRVIGAGTFGALVSLEVLYLHVNKLRVIEAGAFGALKVKELNLDRNELREIEAGAFDALVSLERLYMGWNKFRVIEAGTFDTLKSLVVLNLRSNKLGEIEAGAFATLRNLFALDLSDNKLTTLHPDTFQNQDKLDALGIADNQLNFIPKDMFQNLKRLTNLDLSGNMLDKLPILSRCDMLENVGLRGNPLLWIERDVFTGLKKTLNLLVTKFESCCFASVQCVYDIPPSPFLTCERLLTYDFLRIVIWFVSILGIVGNISVLFTRFLYMPQSNKVQFLLITNLSISDFIMAIYLLILISADLYYTDYFPSHSEAWRGSVLCRIAGALSVLSSEASAFLILMISIDRYLGIKYAFGGRRLRTRSARWIVAILWLVALGISITTFVLSGTDSDFYSVSEVCVGLPISRKESFISDKSFYAYSVHNVAADITVDALEYKSSGSKVFLYLSTAIFTVLNLVCFIIVGLCYLALFISARKTTRKSSRSVALAEELRMAGKMSLIVFTDFCCWVPIGILSILVQANAVNVSPTAYAWIATFVLPINSTINPFLYTLAAFLWDKVKCPSSNCQKQPEQRENIEMRVIPGPRN